MRRLIPVYPDDVWRCYGFARDMRNRHNNNMIMDRTPEQIFRDDLRGKLAEIATARYFDMLGVSLSQEIDFEPYERGIWDRDDLVIRENGDKHISVKSSGENSDYLLIETRRFIPDTGEYSYRNNDDSPIVVDYYAFVNVSMEGEDEDNFTRYESKQDFLRVEGNSWQQQPNARKFFCTFRGLISHNDFWNRKMVAAERIKANKQNFARVFNGETVLPDPQFIINDRRWLQKENYIVSLDILREYRELQRGL